ncbi:MAG: hypothetical protein H5U09_11090, partial [Desulfomicrobiaceae bacterium]|nr:hypothetical protein [Desulfomicrobiaceae bacterium]
WTIIAWMRQREIVGLRNRLHDEYLQVGKTAHNAWKTGSSLDISSGEVALALRQVDFLLDEIRHLEDALAEEKQRFFQEKGLNVPPQSE